MSIGSIDLHILEQLEAKLEVYFQVLLEVLDTPYFDSEELVAWKYEYLQPSLMKLFVELHELSEVCASKSSLAGDIDHEIAFGSCPKFLQGKGITFKGLQLDVKEDFRVGRAFLELFLTCFEKCLHQKTSHFNNNLKSSSGQFTSARNTKCALAFFRSDCRMPLARLCRRW